MAEQKISPMMAAAAVFVGFGVAGVVSGALMGSDPLLLVSPIFFIAAGGAAYRTRLERKAESKLPSSGVFDPSKFKP